MSPGGKTLPLQILFSLFSPIFQMNVLVGRFLSPDLVFGAASPFHCGRGDPPFYVFYPFPSLVLFFVFEFAFISSSMPLSRPRSFF